MICTFDVGDKLVCIEDITLSPWFCHNSWRCLPELGKVYTVRGLHPACPDVNIIAVYLAEIISPPEHWSCGHDHEIAWRHDIFRRVQPLQASIDALARLTAPCPINVRDLIE
jgi:hypothetical protein